MGILYLRTTNTNMSQEYLALKSWQYVWEDWRCLDVPNQSKNERAMTTIYLNVGILEVHHISFIWKRWHWWRIACKILSACIIFERIITHHMYRRLGNVYLPKVPDGDEFFHSLREIPSFQKVFVSSKLYEVFFKEINSMCVWSIFAH